MRANCAQFHAAYRPVKTLSLRARWLPGWRTTESPCTKWKVRCGEVRVRVRARARARARVRLRLRLRLSAGVRVTVRDRVSIVVYLVGESRAQLDSLEGSTAGVAVCDAEAGGHLVRVGGRVWVRVRVGVRVRVRVRVRDRVRVKCSG